MTETKLNPAPTARERTEAALAYLDGAPGVENAELRTDSVTFETPETTITVEIPHIAATSDGPAGIISLNHAASENDLTMRGQRADVEHTHELRPPSNDPVLP